MEITKSVGFNSPRLAVLGLSLPFDTPRLSADKRLSILSLYQSEFFVIFLPCIENTHIHISFPERHFTATVHRNQGVVIKFVAPLRKVVAVVRPPGFFSLQGCLCDEIRKAQQVVQLPPHQQFRVHGQCFFRDRNVR